ncbi:MAG: hypothetical protein LAT83_06980 [Kiritimatiellae bacterium]|nr:hypothetical protein [Kiritimatiellia bacterium]
MIKWRNGELSKQDETQIASDRNYLLIASADSLYLIHRHKRWKGKLDPYAESLFKQRGAKAFRRMHKHLGKHE